MGNAPRIDRRTFIGAAVAAVGAAAVGPFATDVALAQSRGRLVPDDRLGLQQWAVRDAITRVDGSVMGYLGGDNFPADPADLGPLVPLPGGFEAVYRYLASVGYGGFVLLSFYQ